MLCHLTDSYRASIGERDLSMIRFPLPRTILKWLVLRAPMKWGKNAPTRPEVEQGKGGTPPTEFEADRRALLQSIDRFCLTADASRTPHPMMGVLSREEWMRWGYLHADHHLRQFGA